MPRSAGFCIASQLQEATPTGQKDPRQCILYTRTKTKSSDKGSKSLAEVRCRCHEQKVCNLLHCIAGRSRQLHCKDGSAHKCAFQRPLRLWRPRWIAYRIRRLYACSSCSSNFFSFPSLTPFLPPSLYGFDTSDADTRICVGVQASSRTTSTLVRRHSERETRQVLHCGAGLDPRFSSHRRYARRTRQAHENASIHTQPYPHLGTADSSFAFTDIRLPLSQSKSPFRMYKSDSHHHHQSQIMSVHRSRQQTQTSVKGKEATWRNEPKSRTVGKFGQPAWAVA